MEKETWGEITLQNSHMINNACSTVSLLPCDKSRAPPSSPRPLGEDRRGKKERRKFEVTKRTSRHSVVMNLLPGGKYRSRNLFNFMTQDPM